jgi:glycosyltransferase involved in cell wall biosynthesis
VPETPEPVRILRLFSRLNIGGPSVHVILLTAGMRHLGYETRLVVGREEPHEGNLLGLAGEKGVRCEQLAGLGREIRPLSDIRTLWELYRMMKSWRPAIVHTHAAKAGVVGRLAAWLAGVPVVVHTYHGHSLRGYFGRAKTAFFLRLETALGRITHAIIAVSEAVRADLAELRVAARERIQVIPLGLELSHLAGSLPRGALRGEAADAPLIGIVGRLVPIKDVGTFLAAAALVRQSFPDARFAVVGDGEVRAALEAEARRLGLTEVTTFHGWRRDLAHVYGDLDVAVNSSLNEGTPVSLIEAMAAGCPVVATAVGGTPDVLGAGSRGLLVPARDAPALAQAIVETLTQRSAAAGRVAAARQHVLTLHSAERLIGDLDRLYRSLLPVRVRAA